MHKKFKEHLIENAEHEGKSLSSMFISRLPRFLFMAPGFVLALLFPINPAGYTYNWYSGIFHGWLAPCNMLMHSFSNEILYIATDTPLTYNICWCIFLIYGLWVLFLLVFFKTSEWPWSLIMQLGNQFINNAKYENRSLLWLFASRLAKTLSFTIPGFICVLLFPIKADQAYGWFYGVWHGWFAACNWIISNISTETLYVAPNGTEGYNICWWIFCAWGNLLIFCLLFMNFTTASNHAKIKFISPWKPISDDIPTNGSGTPEEQLKTNISKRIIKVFISSTFQDMHKERDYLMTKIFPRLQEVAKVRNVRIIPIDLRWGITEEESRTGKVLELCLQEIDNSTPFFIGIIGKRYGWRPSIDDYDKSELLKTRYPWIKEDFKQGLSITEIEMQYGVLRRKERINAFFFTTEGNADVIFELRNNDAGRIANLKQQILADGRYPIITEFDTDAFGKRVYDVFIDYLDEYFPINQQSLSDSSIALSDNKHKLSIREYITIYLSEYGKKLSEQQLSVLCKHPLSNNRIVLKSILDELILLGKYEELNDYMTYLLEANSPCDLYEKILERAERLYGRKNVRTFFSVLRVSNTSISIKDVLDISDIDEDECENALQIDVDFSLNGIMRGIKAIYESVLKGTLHIKRKPFDLYFSEYLQRGKNDDISLVHEYMQQAVDARYLSNEKDVELYKKKLKDYMRD